MRRSFWEFVQSRWNQLRPRTPTPQDQPEQQHDDVHSEPRQTKAAKASIAKYLAVFVVVLALIFIVITAEAVSGSGPFGWLEFICIAILVILAIYLITKWQSLGWVRISFLLLFAIVVIVTTRFLGEEKPWERWQTKSIGLVRKSRQQLPVFPPTVRYERPGPDLVWGENRLAAGQRYYFNRNAYQMVNLLSRWHNGIKLTAYREGFEEYVWWEIVFRQDKSSRFGINNPGFSNDGEYYYVPSDDMVVRIYYWK